MTAQSVPGALERLAAAEITIAKQDKRITECEAFIATLRAAIGGTSSSGVGAVASDTDLDGKYGNPKVRCDPKDWKESGGATRKGWLMARCEPEFLDMYAETLEYFAQKSDAEGAKASNNKPKSFYDRADAARARGWAKRLRNGWQAPQATQPAAFGGTRRFGTSGFGANAKHTGTPERSSVVDDPHAPRDDEPPPDEDDGGEIPF